MKCPFCQSNLSKVVDKRSVDSRGEVRRRREGLKCANRFTTYEVLAEVEISVLKKDGKKEPFEREKLQRGLVKALEKRPGIDRVSSILDRIESRIREKRLQEVSSQVLGKWVLVELKKLDPVAYLRFASVYRTFSDPKDFKKEIETL
ncbi:transcriptional regulator NrdR [Candidatus Daviesbacteria bacterium RIFCSPHIGHO2_01_FULL_40_11]|uniref:Transcriptional repressor NrdR n=1 Tax=Candidatus Daviesbacteria bacterium RIFCSPHIGHO2_01_FULL_40_11 TaxID=1797762 RepID=A0A1F5JGF4_9BACT|nr:MAG: transcriptional regulator NrdR [Candidatus Daviesbacteria bacterium RIFCSPHIGHO2_01_FULL_40_11]